MDETGRTLSSKELMDIAEKAGERLGWSSRYLSLVATAVGAIFRVNGVPWDTGSIAIDPDSVSSQVEALGLPQAGGKTGKGRTAATYATTWKRLTRIAREWQEKRTEAGEKGEASFWQAGILEFKDPRVRRRLSKMDQAGVQRWDKLLPSHAQPSSGQAPEGDDDLRFVRVPVPLEAGPATLLLPAKMTEADALAVIAAVLQHTAASL